MPVNITNINELLYPEGAGPPSSWTNMGATVQSACHNFKISGTSECGDLADVEVFLTIESFEPVLYNKVVRTIEISPGKDIETWKSKDPRVTFLVYGDEELHNLLQLVESHKTIMFINIAGGQDEEVQSMTIETTPDGVLLGIRITLSFKASETISTICCGSYYEAAPFNECDGEGQTGDPNNDPDCAAYAVSIAFTAAPDTLTASTVGGGTGVETFKWYKDGVYFGEGASINPVLSGVYRVDAKKGNCTDSAFHTYSLSCAGFEVTIQIIILGDGTVVYIATANLLSTYQWQEEIAAVWTNIDGETGASYQPSATGTFRVVATSGTCVDESESVEYQLPASCDGVFTITLMNVAGVLTVTIVDYAGIDTPAYAWYLDTGTGFVLLGSETGPTIVNPAPGFYQVVVNIVECVQVAGLLVQCDYEATGSPCDTESIWYQEFEGDGTTLAFTVTNFTLPDPAIVTANQINAAYMVQVNGVTRGFLLVPVDGTKYGIDYPNQQIEFAAGFAPLVGEVVSITKLNWIQI